MKKPKKYITCPRLKCNKRATIHPKYGISLCKTCKRKPRLVLVKGPEFYSRTQTERVQDQREDPQSSTDMLQPWQNGFQPNPDFVKAYPQETKEYFTPEQLKEADL